MDASDKAVVTVLGFDQKGIIAEVSRILYENDANILDISQTVMSGLFNMILLADVSSALCSFAVLSEQLARLGETKNLQIRIQRSDIFEAIQHV